MVAIFAELLWDFLILSPLQPCDTLTYYILFYAFLRSAHILYSFSCPLGISQAGTEKYAVRERVTGMKMIDSGRDPQQLMISFIFPQNFSGHANEVTDPATRARTRCKILRIAFLAWVVCGAMFCFGSPYNFLECMKLFEPSDSDAKALRGICDIVQFC